MSMWRLFSDRSVASTVPPCWQVEQVGRVRHLDQLDVVGHRALAAAALQVGAERRAADRRQHAGEPPPIVTARSGLRGRA